MNMSLKREEANICEHKKTNRQMQLDIQGCIKP